MTTTMQEPKTRAVVRKIDPGFDDFCVHCDTYIKWASLKKQFQVIANIYVDGKWNRVEHFHAPCYELAGSPHGPVLER